MRILLVRDHEIPIIRDILSGSQIDLRDAIAQVGDLDPPTRAELVQALEVVSKIRERLPMPQSKPRPDWPHRPLIP